jgi:hypothetical protein
MSARSNGTTISGGALASVHGRQHRSRILRSVKGGLRAAITAERRERVWRRVVDTPGLARLYYALDPDLRHLRLRPGTDLLIDGFPRSANTYTSEAILLANPGLTLAHHLHQPRPVEWAVERNTPALLLIRDPDAAVASFRCFEPRIPIDQAYAGYAYYYERLSPIVPALVVAEFDEVVGDLARVIATLNTRYGLKLTAPAADAAAQIFERVDDFSRSHFGEQDFDAKVARPAERRAPEDSVADGADPEVRARAYRAYERVIAARAPLVP